MDCAEYWYVTATWFLVSNNCAGPILNAGNSFGFVASYEHILDPAKFFWQDPGQEGKILAAIILDLNKTETKTRV